MRRLILSLLAAFLATTAAEGAMAAIVAAGAGTSGVAGDTTAVTASTGAAAQAGTATGEATVASAAGERDRNTDDGGNYALWDAANTAYVNNDFTGAILRYDSILATGKVSAKLYYNLANAHFKAGEIGRAILNYNRALRLAPSNDDIRYNLAIAQSYAKDNIEKVPVFFLLRWLRGARTLVGANAWAWMSLAMLAAMLAAALLYLLARHIPVRKTGFYCALALAVLFIFAASNAAIGRREMTDPDKAIVVNNAAPVKSSPDANSKDIFVVHEGTVVTILSRLAPWYEITLADGNKGWILASAVEVI